MHQHSLDLMAEFRRDHLDPRKNDALTILDLGSQDFNGSYREVLANPRWRYIGLDLTPGPNVDVVLRDAYDWRELQSESADVLVSGQTFEHTEFFWETMSEIARVLKPGGLCCIIAPSCGPEHRYPRDCWRIFPDGFAAVARYAHLEVLDSRTQWEDLPGYDYENNKWHDSILIARKPRLPLGLRSRLRFFAWLKRWFQPAPGPADSIVQVFPMLGGELRESDSLYRRFAPNEWRDVCFRLPKGAAGAPLRIDFISPFPVVDVGRIRLKASGNTLYDASADKCFGGITVAADAERVPNPKFLRVKITGIDPQLHLPMVAVPAGEEVEVHLRLRAHDPHRLEMDTK
jgi:SAM-dependent methyltransferase